MEEVLTTPVEAEVPQGEDEPQRDKSPAAGRTKCGSHPIACDFVKGFFLALAALVLKVAFEQTALGEEFQASAYNYLQLRLATPGLNDPLPVAVVDISELPQILETSGGWTRLITPRPELEKLIAAVAEQHPKAVGIDIDFAPDARGYMWPNDPGFFKDCVSTSEENKVPIFLGVWRSLDLAPESWLGDPEYKSLAATVSVGRLDGRRVTKWTRRDGDTEPGQSLSAALAKNLAQSGSSPPSWLRWALEDINEARLADHSITIGEFLVDHGLLELIRDKTLRTINPLVIKDQGKWFLKDKVVLLGDATIGRADTTNVPGQKEPVPGVYLHACASYTLTHPLYELTFLGRTVIDLSLSALLGGIIAAIRVRVKNNELDVSLVRGFLTLIIVMAAFVVGIIFVRRTRVIWDDFILVIAVLLMHPLLEKLWFVLKNKVGPAIVTMFRN